MRIPARVQTVGMTGEFAALNGAVILCDAVDERNVARKNS
jgi:hypothetical protein